MTDVAILIPMKDEAVNIQSCLDAVFSQNTSFSYEVILVDSGSTDGTLELIGNYPVSLYQISAKDFHHARTRNYLSTLAQSKYLVYLNADAFPASSNWLTSLICNFEDPAVGAVYGRQLPKQDCNAERAAVLATVYGDQRLVKEPSRKRELGFRYYHLSTVNAAIRREVWVATKFPEDLMTYEDVGIAKRILDAGWRIVYDPAASVYHSDNHSLGGLFKRYFDIGIVWNRLALFDDDVNSSMLHEGWRMLRRKLAGRKQGPLKKSASLRMTVQEFIKYTAIILGKNENLLPVGLKRRMSGAGFFTRDVA